MTTAPRVPERFESAPDGLFVVHGELVSSQWWAQIDGFAVPAAAHDDAMEWSGLDVDVLTDAPPPRLHLRPVD